jgi:hypothetical protein
MTSAGPFRNLTSLIYGAFDKPDPYYSDGEDDNVDGSAEGAEGIQGKSIEDRLEEEDVNRDAGVMGAKAGSGPSYVQSQSAYVQIFESACIAVMFWFGANARNLGRYRDGRG